MKILVKSAIAAGLLALAACGGGGDDRAAENVEEAEENRADAIRDQADNVANDVVEERLEQKADNVEEAGEEKADAIDDSDGADNVDSNVSGM